MHSQNAALGLVCWLPGIKLLTRTTALTAFVVVALCGCTESSKSYQQMTGDEQLNHLRAQADQAMLAEATNVVPNIRDVIEEHADTFADSVEKWRGWLRVEYIDFSGSQRTNIPMAFLATYDGRLFGFVPTRVDSFLITNQ